MSVILNAELITEHLLAFSNPHAIPSSYHKPQTTRNRITAIVNKGDTQFVLMDTPGFHNPKTRLGDYMVKVVKESIVDVDALMLLVEPIPNIGAPEQQLIEAEKLQERLSQAREVLSKKEWQILQLFLTEYSYEQIARMTDTTVKSVDNAMQRVRKKLKTIWNYEAM